MSKEKFNCESIFPVNNIWNFLENTYQPTNIYNSALEIWKSSYDYDYLVSSIIYIMNSDSHKDEEFKIRLKYIAQQRKKGGKLMSAWRMVGNSHRNPKPLSKLIYHMGKFKDMKKKPNARKAAGKILLDRLQSYDESLASEQAFIPATFDSFAEKYKSVIFPLKNIELNEKLHIEDYHEIRRQIRLVTHYFQLLDFSVPIPVNNNATLLADFFKNITWEMGRVQSGFSRKSVAGKIDYDSSNVIIDPKLLKSIQLLLASHS